MMTRKELREYIWIKEDVETLRMEIEELETRATNITTNIDDMPKGSPRKDKLSAIVCQIVELQNKMDNQITKGYERLKAIVDFIEGLEGRNRIVARLRYMEGLSWDEISERTKITRRHLHNIDRYIMKKLD
jgi:DNA-directed RNA polymerase specialized sigma subunit